MLALTVGVPVMPTFQGPLWVTGSDVFVTITGATGPAETAWCGTKEIADPAMTIPRPANNILAKRFISFILFLRPDSFGESGLCFLNGSFLLSAATLSDELQHGNGGRVKFEARLGNGAVTP